MEEIKLPIVKNRKKIDSKKIESLAKKVRKSFEEENEYIKDHSERYFPPTAGCLSSAPSPTPQKTPVTY